MINDKKGWVVNIIVILNLTTATLSLLPIRVSMRTIFKELFQNKKLKI